jgi:poly-gamma-glutamate synthesis protein (capsule biosynthesis protein)
MPQPSGLTVLLAGDVMTGRGIDQILGHPSEPELREPYLSSALEYVELAERAHGPVPMRVDAPYIWGEGLSELARADFSVVNLETSITSSDDFSPDKRIHYRMHPDNIGCLTAARIDACALANNHVLDFGHAGLAETLAVLRAAGIHTAGAGRDIDEAARPACLPFGSDGAALLVFSFGTDSSGIPDDWAAGPFRSGVWRIDEISDAVADTVTAHVRARKRPGDLAIVSIHWGTNWGYEIPRRHMSFARRLVDGGVDLVHGHSSHHARSVEHYHGRLILYGCGDLITDYEGIRGYEEWRGDIGAMYFASLAADGALQNLQLTPTQMRNLSLMHAGDSDGEWLRDTLDRISRPLGCRFELDERRGIQWISTGR